MAIPPPALVEVLGGEAVAEGGAEVREILFKAKRTDNGEWVEGYYLRYGHTSDEKSYIIPTYASALYHSEVDPDTLCQYTGLTDKNGVKIFEGDIILAKDTGYKAVVEWQPDTCRFLAMITNCRDETSPHFFYVDKGSDRWCQMSSNEVVGSIHDKEAPHEH